MWYIFDNVFTFVFLGEFLLKMLVMKFACLKGTMNIIDACLVVLGIADTWVLPFANACGSDSSPLRFLLVIRILRVVRVVRFFRLIKTFEQLWIIISGFAAAIRTALWVFLFVALFVYMCAIFTTIQIGEGPYFDSVISSMISLWQIATLDCWSDPIVRTVLGRSPWFLVFFIPFIFITTYGVFNVILGIVVDSTVRSAELKTEKELKEQEIGRQLTLAYLKRVIEITDSGESGHISRDEFIVIWNDRDVQLKMITILNLTLDQVLAIFEVLGDIEGFIPITEFITAVSQASSSGLYQRNLTQVIHALDKLVCRLNLAQTELTLHDNEIDTLSKRASVFASRTLYFLTGLYIRYIESYDITEQFYAFTD